MTFALLETEMNEPVAVSEDDVSGYLREIRQYPLLTPQQERELAQRCAQGDEEAVRSMVSSNLRLVVSVAREYAGRGVPLMDMIQEGSIGLLAAAKKFDYTLDYRFSTYATKWIRQGVTRCIANHNAMIRVPAHTAERMRKVIAAKSAIEQESGRIPTEAQIAVRCGMPEEKVKTLLRLYPEVCSLDVPAGTDADATLGILLEDLQAPQPQEELVRQELRRSMEMLLSRLTERQQQVLRLRFGMEDGETRSLEETGKYLGISKERARQLEIQAIKQLHKLGTGLGLEDFLNE